MAVSTNPNTWLLASGVQKQQSQRVCLLSQSFSRLLLPPLTHFFFSLLVAMCFVHCRNSVVSSLNLIPTLRRPTSRRLPSKYVEWQELKVKKVAVDELIEGAKMGMGGEVQG